MSKGLLIILIIAVVAVFTGVYFLTTNDQARLTDEEALVLAAQKTASLNSYVSDITLGLEGRSPDVAVNASLTGEVRVDNRQESLAGNIKVDAQIQQMGQGITLSFAGEFIILENRLFAKMETVPEMLLFFLPEEIVGQWILISEDIQGEIENELYAQEMDLQQLEEAIEELLVRLWEKEVFIITAKEKDSVNNLSLDKHAVTIIPERLISFWEEDLIPFLEEIEAEGIPSLTEEEKEDLLEQMELALEHFRLYVWSDSNHIHLVRAEAEIPQQEMIEEGSLLLEISYRDFNQPLVIEAPTDFISIDDLADELEYDLLDFGPAPQLQF